MHLIVLVLYTLFMLVWFVIDVASQNLVTTILKGLVFLSMSLPGFQTFLENEIVGYQVPIAGVPSTVRGLTQNWMLSMGLRQISGVDILEVDSQGKLHSLLRPASVYNGLAPSEIARVSGVLPILLLDQATVPVEVDSPGPILLTKAHPAAHVRSRSAIFLCDKGELDVGHIQAPLMVADRELNVSNLRPGTALVDFKSALNLARITLLKTIRGEPLVAPTAKTFPAAPKSRSLVMLALKKMSCVFKWGSLKCQWELPAADVQVVVDQLIGRPYSAVKYSFGNEPFKVDIKMYSPRALLEGNRVGVQFDVVLTAPRNQGPVSTLLENPVHLWNVTGWIDFVKYDPQTGLINYGKPVVTALETSLLDAPLRDLVLSGVNLMLDRQFEEKPSYDLKSYKLFGKPILASLLRSLEIKDGKLHAQLGIGRCEKIVTGENSSDL